MAKKTMGWSVWVSLGLVVLVLVVMGVNGHVDCGNTLGELALCLEYLEGDKPVPTPGCCAMAQTLANNIAAASQPDKQAYCECFKIAAQRFPFDRRTQFAKVCQLNVPITFDPNATCTAI